MAPYPWFMKYSDRFIYKETSNGRCATNRYFQVIGSIHDIESYYGVDNALSLNYVQVFACHLGHLGIIFVFILTNLFHIAWGGNYEIFIKNPTAVFSISHPVLDPHFSYASSVDFDAYTCFSGIYNWLLAIGFTRKTEIYNASITCSFLGILLIWEHISRHLGHNMGHNI